MSLTIKKNRKVVFAYNGPLKTVDYSKFYSNELNDTLVKRYLVLGSSVTFLIRIVEDNCLNAAKILELKGPNVLIRQVPEFNDLKSFFLNRKKIDSVIEDEIKNADILVARLPSFIGRRAIFFANKYRIPFIAEVVGCPFDALYNHSFRGLILAPFAYLLMKKYVRRSNYVIYVTKMFLQNRYPNRENYLAISDVNISPETKIDIQKKIESITTKLQNGEVLNIGTIGGLDIKYKGQISVIKAVYALKKKGFQFKYFIVGRGAGTHLKSMIDRLDLNNEVKIVGELKPGSILNFLDQTDIYVQPSMQEGLPRSLVEAMSRGCFCIGTNVGGIPELLDSKHIYRPNSISDLVDLLIRINSEAVISDVNRNIKISNQFDSDILEKKRNEFYLNFLNDNNFCSSN